MKKLLLTFVLVTVAWTASAQDWAIGGRVRGGIDVVGQKYFDENYVELRVGLNAISGIGVDVSGLYAWNITQMDWTPSAGKWFFDAGVGANLGLSSDFYVGVQGMAKLGIEFNVPVRLSIDWSPSVGVLFGDSIGFNGPGLWGNWGITCVYRF